jgi:hypothetical protein
MSAGGRDLLGKVLALHDALEVAGLPHAFGGALALAWCVGNPRGTADIDLNVLVPVEEVAVLLAALPAAMTASEAARQQLVRDGQARVWWDRTPVDLFLNTTEFHEGLAARVRHEDVAGIQLPVLDCSDLAVFKAFSSRGKDWVDLGDMLLAKTVEVDGVLGTLVRHLGGDDPRIERLRALAADVDARL